MSPARQKAVFFTGDISKSLRSA